MKLPSRERFRRGATLGLVAFTVFMSVKEYRLTKEMDEIAARHYGDSQMPLTEPERKALCDVEGWNPNKDEPRYWQKREYVERNRSSI